MTPILHATVPVAPDFDLHGAELEETLLDEALDLLSIARCAAERQSRAYGEAADELALASLLEAVL